MAIARTTPRRGVWLLVLGSVLAAGAQFLPWSAIYRPSFTPGVAPSPVGFTIPALGIVTVAGSLPYDLSQQNWLLLPPDLLFLILYVVVVGGPALALAALALALHRRGVVGGRIRTIGWLGLWAGIAFTIFVAAVAASPPFNWSMTIYVAVWWGPSVASLGYVCALAGLLALPKPAAPPVWPVT